MFSFLLGLVLSVQVFAGQNAEPDGVRVVGKGGGFAEMQVYAFDKNLPFLVRICHQRPESCGLSSKEQDILQVFVLRQYEVLNSVLTINPTCVAPYVHLGSALESSVDSCYLYENEQTEFGPVPKSLQEIGAAVILIRFVNILGVQANLEEIRVLANKLLRNLDVTSQSSVVEAGRQIYKLNLLSLQAGERRRSFLSFESVQSSVDLTKDLESSLNCAGLDLDWSLQEIRVENLGSDLGRVQGQIEWSCALPEGELQKYRATLVLDLMYQNETLDSVHFSTLGKERL
ncbi:hypothetical protein D3C87_1272890 [compost metagenome]